MGIVLDYNKDTKKCILEQRNYFKPGDVVEFFGPNTEVFTFTIPDEIRNEKDELIEVANHPRMIVKFKCDHNLAESDMMRIKVFDISDFL